MTTADQSIFSTVAPNLPFLLDGTVDLNFEDGSEKKGFDLLVGADGIWSAIRAQMWGESTAKPGTCTYSGYTLFAAENVMEPASDFFADEGYFDAGYKVYIGPGKYFVTSDVGSGRIQWYAFLALPPGTKSRSSNLDYVKDQFKGWTNEIHACLDNTPGDIIEQRDLYDRRPSVTKSWSKGHVTMMGDAVHPVSCHRQSSHRNLVSHECSTSQPFSHKNLLGLKSHSVIFTADDA